MSRPRVGRMGMDSPDRGSRPDMDKDSMGMNKGSRGMVKGPRRMRAASNGNPIQARLENTLILKKLNSHHHWKSVIVAPGLKNNPFRPAFSAPSTLISASSTKRVSSPIS